VILAQFPPYWDESKIERRRNLTLLEAIDQTGYQQADAIRCLEAANAGFNRIWKYQSS
jgi:hypothetical protein